jgi:hypothetical protein
MCGRGKQRIVVERGGGDRKGMASCGAALLCSHSVVCHVAGYGKKIVKRETTQSIGSLLGWPVILQTFGPPRRKRERACFCIYFQIKRQLEKRVACRYRKEWCSII